MKTEFIRIGKNIQILRKSKKITQEQMAEFMDVSISYISQIERGATSISLGVLYQISDFLDCTVSNLIEGTKDNILELVKQDKEKRDSLLREKEGYQGGFLSDKKSMEFIKIVKEFLPENMDVYENIDEAIPVLLESLGKKERVLVAYFIACYLKMKLV